MKKTKVLMGALALVMVTTVIIACTKEKEMRPEMVVTYGDFHCNNNGGGVED